MGCETSVSTKALANALVYLTKCLQNALGANYTLYLRFVPCSFIHRINCYILKHTVTEIKTDSCSHLCYVKSCESDAKVQQFQ